MAFLCTGDDMLFSAEGGFTRDYKLKLKAPKTSYEIITQITKNTKEIEKVEIKPTKGFLFNKDSIPNWLDIIFYSIKKKNGKRISSIHIENKCLMSKNPYLLEQNVILYFHENETDLLRTLPFLIDISIQMKCDIVSFDYQGFGHSYDRYTKVNNNTLFDDGETAIDFFCTKFLKYKIENVILMGKEIGAMIGIYLSSMDKYNKCKSLILYNPIITSNNKINIKLMRSINCKCFLIYEIESKEEIEQNDIIYLCREIPNQKEWFPLKKKKSENINKFFGFKKYIENLNFDDIYIKHRMKFIMKLRNYICPEEENSNKMGKGSSGESTESESNNNLSLNKIMKFIDNDEEKIEEKESNENNIFDADEIHIDNTDDY